MKIKIILFLLIITNLSIAQQKGIVYYGYIEALQNGNAKGPDYNAYMVFNKEQSYYVTAKDSLEKAEKINEDKTFLNEEDNGRTIYSGMKSSSQGDQVVYNIKKNTMWSSFLFRKQVYVKEIVPKMIWKIEKETKKIGKFTCKKATAIFKGRNYTAWFTTEIALPYGPWKLNGLPGLILEAYETNKFVYWYFKSIEYPTNNKENVSYLKTQKAANFLTPEEFNVFRKEQQAKMVESGILIQKQFPNITYKPPTLQEMFVEFE